MRRIIALATLAVALALPLTLAAKGGAKAPAKSTTVVGEVIDAGCYMMDGAKATGEGHKDCATKCFAKGMPAALLTPKGDVILLTPDHENGEPYATARTMPGEKVSVTGMMMKRGGMSAMTVTECKKAS